MDGTSLIWMPPSTTMPPLRRRQVAAGTRLADRRKDDGGVEGDGGGAPPRRRPTRSRVGRKRSGCRRRPSESVIERSLEQSHLSHDMGGGTEAINTQSLGSPALRAHYSRSIRHTAAERRKIVVGVRQAKAVGCVRDRQFCIPAIDLIAGGFGASQRFSLVPPRQ